MLKRTITLVGLTITLGALLLALGCSGSNTNPVAPVSSDQPLVSRQENQPPSKPWVSVGMNVWGEKFVLFRATDLNNDRLKYRVILRNGGDFIFDQTVDSSGFSKPDYASGEWGAFKVPKNNLPSGFYQVYVQAHDGTIWGPTNNPPRYISLP